MISLEGDSSRQEDLNLRLEPVKAIYITLTDDEIWFSLEAPTTQARHLHM